MKTYIYNKVAAATIRKASVLCTLCSVLLISSCTNEEVTPPAETITLTTPVIELSSVQATTRAAQSLTDVADAYIYLYLHDTEERKYSGRSGLYYGENRTWTAYSTVTVIGGEGHYRAGIFSSLNLKATTDMTFIKNAIYAYRGSINVRADGTFTPDGTLQPHSAAVLLNLKDADGNIIAPDNYASPDGIFAGEIKFNSDVYLINPVGLAAMKTFVSTDADGNVDLQNGQFFPNGTADPVPEAFTWYSYSLTSVADGSFTPGTYPATWEEDKLVTSAPPTTAWTLFEVTYCKEGFEYNADGKQVPAGSTITTWTVSYPAGQQLTLKPGKLYTFTATLGRDAHITLDTRESVTVTDWTEGSTINVGK